MKTRLIAFLAAFGLTIIAAIIGNVLESKGILTREKMGPRALLTVYGVFFGLFCLICVTLIPLVIRLCSSGQIKIGNGEVAVIKWLQQHENAVVIGLWAFFFFGLFIIFALARDQILKNLM